MSPPFDFYSVNPFFQLLFLRFPQSPSAPPSTYSFLSLLFPHLPFPPPTHAPTLPSTYRPPSPSPPSSLRLGDRRRSDTPLRSTSGIILRRVSPQFTRHLRPVMEFLVDLNEALGKSRLVLCRPESQEGRWGWGGGGESGGASSSIFFVRAS